MFDFLHSVSSALAESPVFFIGFSIIFGTMIGSFLNVVIHRLPKMMEHTWHQNCLELQGREAPKQPKYNIVVPRSACPKCKHQITAMENIPIISYLILGRKCKGCKTKISMRYPFVEALTGVLIGLVAYQFGYSATTLFAWVLTSALIALAFIDFDTQLLPDDITLPLLWLGLVFNFNHGFTNLQSAVIGAVVGYLILWSVYWLFKIITGKEGMGYGDFKLLAAIGAWFGWQVIPAVILLSSVVGAVIGIVSIILKKNGRSAAIPFGPFLALGGIAALFFGQQLTSFYLA